MNPSGSANIAAGTVTFFTSLTIEVVVVVMSFPPSEIFVVVTDTDDMPAKLEEARRVALDKLLPLQRADFEGDRPALFSAQFALSHACWLVTYPLAGRLGSAAGQLDEPSTGKTRKSDRPSTELGEVPTELVELRVGLTELLLGGRADRVGRDREPRAAAGRAGGVRPGPGSHTAGG